MTFQNRGDGSEAMDMVLDNLGMDDTLDVGNENDDQLDDADLSDGDEDLNDRVSHTDEQDRRDERQRRQQPNDRRQQQSRQQQQPQPQRQLPRGAEVKPDAKGNLVGADGKIIAKAGMEARMYQDLHRTRGEVGRLQSQVTDTTGRLTRAVEIGQGLHTENVALKDRIANLSGTKLGLNDQEQIQAMQLAAESKTDPVAAIKRMLTMAAARGVDMTKLGLAPGGIDPKSILDIVKQEITNAMTPLQQRSTQENAERQRVEAERAQSETAEREVHTFFNQNPDAQPHLAIFNAVLSDPRYSKMSLGEVWARIQLNQALNRQNGNGRQQPARNGNPQQRRMPPAGRGAPVQDNSSGMAPVSASYDTILRDVMDQIGIQ